MTIAEYLASLIQSGPLHLGQVVVSADFVITHSDDFGVRDLQVSHDPNEALEIARYDDSGKYRPLKTAANLRHGWRLVLRDAPEALVALDFLYPAAMGTLAMWQKGALHSVSVRETLARQTGMYAVVKKITDEQIHEVKSTLCGGQPPCLRQILWSTASSGAALSGAIAGNTPPLLCAEICNLFVAEGRKVVKKAVEPTTHSAE
jgi:sirohydrochlorin cobaltochelatase